MKKLVSIFFLLLPLVILANIANYRNGKSGSFFINKSDVLQVLNASVKFKQGKYCIPYDIVNVRNMDDISWEEYLPVNEYIKNCSKYNGKTKTADWNATVNYNIIARKTENQLLIGFPIVFEEDGGDIEGRTYYAGVGNFKVMINNKEVPYKIKKTNMHINNKREVEYMFYWNYDFHKNEEYQFLITYNFISDEVAGDSAGMEKYQCWPICNGFKGFRYELYPLKSWFLKPPQEYSVTIETTIDPLYYNISIYDINNDPIVKPCIDINTITYKTKNSYPDGVLNVNYGNDRDIENINLLHWYNNIVEPEIGPWEILGNEKKIEEKIKSIASKKYVQPEINITCAYRNMIVQKIKSPETRNLINKTKCLKE